MHCCTWHNLDVAQAYSSLPMWHAKRVFRLVKGCSVTLASSPCSDTACLVLVVWGFFFFGLVEEENVTQHSYNEGGVGATGSDGQASRRVPNHGTPHLERPWPHWR